jgi:uncharacterized protein (DUF486 family)
MTSSSSKTRNHLLSFLGLQVMATICSFVALFAQTTPYLEYASYWKKLLHNEFWISMQWLFALPSFRIGYQVLSVPLMFLIGYVLGFVLEILLDKFVLDDSMTVDHYVCILFLLLGLYISKFDVFG